MQGQNNQMMPPMGGEMRQGGEMHGGTQGMQGDMMRGQMGKMNGMNFKGMNSDGGGMQRGNMQDGQGQNGGQMKGGMQNGSSKGGMMGGGESNQNGEQEKMMQEQEKHQQAQQLAGMKRNLSGMGQGINSLKRTIDRLKKKNIAVPADVEALITDLTVAIEKVKSATELSGDVQTALETVQEKSQEVGDWGQKLGMLEQWSKTAAQVEKGIANLDRDLARAKAKKEAAQYPNVITKVEGEVDAVKSAWAEVKTGVDGGDVEGAMNNLQDLFQQISDTQRSIEFIAQLSSVAKMVKNADREITSFEKQVARLEKKKVAVSSVRSLIADGRAKLEEIKALGNKSDVSPDDFFSLMQDVGDIRQQAMEEFNRLSGQSESSALGAAVFQAIEMRRLGF